MVVVMWVGGGSWGARFDGCEMKIVSKMKEDGLG